METWQQKLHEAHEEVLNDFREKWKQLSGGPSIIDSVLAFVAAVDWTEKWLWVVLSVHVLLLLSVIILRKNSAYQATLFTTCIIVVYNAEHINSLARQNWKAFAGQNYFDKSGIFTSSLLSGPLLCIMFVILINYLVECFVLLVKMKRTELAWRAREQRRQASDKGNKKDN